MSALPTGTVTFLFTDLERSTLMWEQQPDAMREALEHHDAILASELARYGGTVLSEMGDGVAAVFPSAREAAAAALAIQTRLGREEWSDATGELRARIGMHTDEAVLHNGRYANVPLNRCARLMAAGHGGQVLVSGTAAALLVDALPPEAALLDLGEHQLRDLASAMRVFQLTHPELRFEFPALRSMNAVAGNLPSDPTSFVGRDEESERIAATLEGARVVTLTGVGGVGKTRLALHVARKVAGDGRFADGAWLCELAAVRDPLAVPEAMLGAFGVEPQEGAEVTDALLDYLRSKRVLLVLDNCEHLLRPAAQVIAKIEAACPHVRILATSREGLGVAGEWLVAVGSLSVP